MGALTCSVCMCMYVCVQDSRLKDSGLKIIYLTYTKYKDTRSRRLPLRSNKTAVMEVPLLK